MKSTVICTNSDGLEEIVKIFWKKLFILDSIELVEKSWNEIKNSTLNKSWSKLLPELIVELSEPEESYKEYVQSLFRLGIDIEGKGLSDVCEFEILKFLQLYSEPLTAMNIDKILNKESDQNEGVQL